jgi:hypothetical protein
MLPLPLRNFVRVYLCATGIRIDGGWGDAVLCGNPLGPLEPLLPALAPLDDGPGLDDLEVSRDSIVGSARPCANFAAGERRGSGIGALRGDETGETGGMG